MSQRDGFASGFFAGALVGSIVGGVIGALVAAKSSKEQTLEQEDLFEGEESTPEGELKQIETARRQLEGKIAQLNLAIDDVRQQLVAVNHNTNSSSAEEKRGSEDN